MNWVEAALTSTDPSVRVWEDITAFVRLDQPITITRGRQSDIDQVQAGTLSLTLINDDGRFTAGNSQSPYYPNVTLGHLIRVFVYDEQGNPNQRFFGMISDGSLSPDPTGNTADVSLSANGMLAALGRVGSLNSWTWETILAMEPSLFWPLNDAAVTVGSKSIAPQLMAEASGNSGPPLNVVAYQRGGVTGTFEPAADAITETLYPATGPVPAAHLTPSTATGRPGYQFQANIPTRQAVNPITITGFWQLDPSLTYASSIGFSLFSLAHTSQGANLLVSFFPTLVTTYTAPDGSTQNIVQGQLAIGYDVNGANPTSATITTKVTVDGYNDGSPQQVNMFVLSITPGATTATVQLRNYSQSLPSASVPSPHYDSVSITIPLVTLFNQVVVGGRAQSFNVSGASHIGNNWAGWVSMFALFDRSLTDASPDEPDWLFAQASPGLRGKYVPTALGSVNPTQNPSADDQVGLLLTYAGMPGWVYGGNVLTHDSLSAPSWFDINGQTPLQAIQTIQQTETGLLYEAGPGADNNLGQLVFGSRGDRQGNAQPTLNLPEGSYNADLRPELTDQYLTNQVSFNAPGVAAASVSTDTTSTTLYGLYSQGDNQSPVTLPIATNTITPAQTSIAGGGTTLPAVPPVAQSSDAIQDLADWEVFSQSQPGTRFGSLTVAALTTAVDDGGPASEYIPLSALYSVDISDAITFEEELVWFPDQQLANEVFIEGVQEVISTTQHDITYYVTNTFRDRAWIPADPNYGVLDETARLGNDTGNPDAQPGVGPQYDYPVYSATMNTRNSPNAFIGAGTQRGLTTNLTNVLLGPVFSGGQFVSQAFPATATAVTYDSSIDTFSGMQNGNLYVFPLPGTYMVQATLGIPAVASSASVELTATVRSVIAGVTNQTLVSEPVSLTNSASVIQVVGIIDTHQFTVQPGDSLAVEFMAITSVALSSNIANTYCSITYLGNGWTSATATPIAL